MKSEYHSKVLLDQIQNPEKPILKKLDHGRPIHSGEPKKVTGREPLKLLDQIQKSIKPIPKKLDHGSPRCSGEPIKVTGREPLKSEYPGKVLLDYIQNPEKSILKNWTTDVPITLENP